MGRKVRERKLAKMEAIRQQKLEAQERRRARTEESTSFLKKFMMATISTVVLLYLGVIVTAKLEEIVSRISHLIR